ncbi:NUDIX hydrolase [Plantactinospora sp. GCM10030261]|uniref:NUDIX hydrolase n=1 Tax=Plantactinospora sp. GCM10030261 TaxID=3273420 RepID=UPI00361AE993
MELPRDLPVEERDSVRLVVLDREERVLLFHTREITRPEYGFWWELPGGGIDLGETYRETAVRELREETGFRITPDQVGEPTWRRTATFLFREVRRLQHEVVVPVRLTETQPAIDATEQLIEEQEDYVDFRWWSVPDIVASRERFYPGRLPTLLTPFLAGERIDEPFEVFS